MEKKFYHGAAKNDKNHEKFGKYQEKFYVVRDEMEEKALRFLMKNLKLRLSKNMRRYEMINNNI